MMNISVQFVLGSNVLHSVESRFVLADNNQIVGDKISWNTIAKLPMETSMVVKLQMFSREGEGVVVGVGGCKLFD